MLRLCGWFRRIRPATLMDRPTLGAGIPKPTRGYNPLRPGFPAGYGLHRPALQPIVRFRSPLLAESLLLSVPPDTKMFQFSGFGKQGELPPRPDTDQLKPGILWTQALLHPRGFYGPMSHPAKASFSYLVLGGTTMARGRQGFVCLKRGRRDLNPLRRFWRPEFYEVNYSASGQGHWASTASGRRG